MIHLDCAGVYMGALLERERSCQITAVDRFSLAANVNISQFIKQDINEGLLDVKFSDYDYVPLLDVIEHFTAPEAFADRLRDSVRCCTDTKLIMSTPDVGFFIIRWMPLLGQFNYVIKS